MTLIQALKQSGGARVFAVLSLLCVLGLQSIEASHSYAHLDSTVECPACTSATAAIPSDLPVSFICDAGSVLPAAGSTSAARDSIFRVYYSRGPPHIS